MRKFSGGFGLIEMLIAMTITGLVMFGVMQVMDNMGRMGRRGDVKTELSNVESRLKNLLSDDETCKATLTSQIAQPVFTPGAAGLQTWNQNDSAARVRFPDGTFLEANTKVDKFVVQGLSVRLIGPFPDGTRYDAELVIGVDSTQAGGRILAGGEMAARKIPLVLRTDLVPNGGGTRKIVGCYWKGLTGQQTCESIGGRWIESINKCFLGGDLKLDQFTCVDPAEFGAGRALEGATVEECYYRNNNANKMAVYKCINMRNQNGPRCNCEPLTQNTGNQGQAGWRVKNPVTDRFFFNCDGGVMIKVADERSTYLDYNEYIEGKFMGSVPTDANGVAVGTAFGGTSLTIAEFLQNHDILDTVTDCAYEGSASNRTFQCRQEANAIKGGRGSCIFITNGVAYDPASTRIPNYTGWIFVTYPRGLFTVGAGANQATQVVEAQGRKCHLVKRSAVATPEFTSNYTGTNGSAVGGPNDTLTEDSRWQHVRECMYLGAKSAGDSTGTDINPPVNAGSAGVPARGQYLHRFPCNNADLDVTDLTGFGSSKDPDLNLGHCWYFKDVYLPVRYNTRAAHTASLTPADTASAGKYTGWVYLTGNLRDAQWKQDAGNAVIMINNAAGRNQYNIIPGVPCNAGVRIAK